MATKRELRIPSKKTVNGPHLRANRATPELPTNELSVQTGVLLSVLSDLRSTSRRLQAFNCNLDELSRRTLGPMSAPHEPLFVSDDPETELDEPMLVTIQSTQQEIHRHMDSMLSIIEHLNNL